VESAKVAKRKSSGMKIPTNMTEQQVIDQINIVVNRISARYTFHGYTVDDIKQEAFMICMDALDRYDHNRPLENFLSVHLSNRLKNFVRDNFYTKGEDEKKRVLKPSSLSNEEFIPVQSHENVEYLDAKSLSLKVDALLPAEYRSDYLKMINDVYVPKKRREEIVEVIKELINEEG
jgi:DNA-directed RNA polymerase specialized sigma24 family protein